ncbi:TaqI-like C-terminal specificity domain-containing protein [[Clostridium] innocuum]|uniref:TaqI-like C-terminal specificity domain-containing protein n=1 Tax=Clostridium innocuum TaxID=1522 RepID=UPI003A4DDAA0
MYISVSEAAQKFNLSKRRVQILCEQGRIEGARRISGVWLIPENAKKPIDARRKSVVADKQLLFEDDSEIKNDKLNISQACEMLSISQATAKNWIRLGKLKTDTDNEYFDRKYIETLLLEIKTGKDTRLKSRRNKKNVSGKVLYKDYAKSEYNCEIIEEILNSCERIADDELRIILAYYAIQLYQQSSGAIVSECAFFKGQKEITHNNVFNDLIADLLENVDVPLIDLSKIQIALNKKIQFISLEDTLGFVYISLRDLNHRKQTGAYYTPEKTVSALIGSLKKCIDLENKTLCDPCCGTGNFLIGLVGNGAKTTNLYGQDIDEISIQITRINIFLLDNDITQEQLYTQFICNNTLIETFPRKFSVVLGNPPWGYNFTKEETQHLLSNYVTAKNKGMESYDLFVEKGLMMLEKNGYLAYVLPEAILSVTSHQQVRKLVLKKTAFKFVNYIGNSFSGVQCPAIILGLQEGYQGQTKNCCIGLNNKEFVISENRELDSTLFSFNMNDEEYDCLRTISSVKNAKYLANNAKFALGIVTGNNKEYIKSTKVDGMESILKGSDILRYSIKETNNYIQFTPEKFQQVASSEMYRAKEKLLYRFISEVPVFCYDDQQTLSLNSCNILIPQIEGMAMKYVLAILNSSVAFYYIRKKYNSVKLLRSHIESLPIPMISMDEQRKIIKKVDHIMNSSENINGLYEDLDSDIMELFGLSTTHIDIIKNSLCGKNLFLGV